jgi:hypothetical protein
MAIQRLNADAAIRDDHRGLFMVPLDRPRATSAPAKRQWEQTGRGRRCALATGTTEGLWAD